jgi:hypothetical protein
MSCYQRARRSGREHLVCRTEFSERPKHRLQSGLHAKQQDRASLALRADFYNAFNHPQYVPGSIDGVEPIPTTGVGQINTVGQTDFDVPSHVFSSHPRVIQLALRFDF